MKKFIIGVADKYLESWILPFVDKNGNFPKIPTEGFDGKNCKGELKRRLGINGVEYKKKISGIEILLKLEHANIEELAKLSLSFKQFYNEISNHCKWLKNLKSM